MLKTLITAIRAINNNNYYYYFDSQVLCCFVLTNYCERCYGWLTCFEMCRIQILHLESTLGHKKEWKGLTKVEEVAKTKRKD